MALSLSSLPRRPQPSTDVGWYTGRDRGESRSYLELYPRAQERESRGGLAPEGISFWSPPAGVVSIGTDPGQACPPSITAAKAGACHFRSTHRHRVRVVRPDLPMPMIHNR